jgi:hypothetical protein
MPVDFIIAFTCQATIFPACIKIMQKRKKQQNALQTNKRTLAL